MPYIYLITDNRNGMQYVGQSKRKSAYYTSSVIINRILKKNGKIAKEFLKREIVVQGNFNEILLNELERHYIRLFNTKHPHGYNLTDGGEGNKNPTVEERKRKSDHRTRLWKDPGFRSRVVPLIQEANKKRRSIKGMRRNYETTDKQREHNRTKFTIPRLGVLNGNYGNKWTASQRLAFSIKKKKMIAEGKIVVSKGSDHYLYGQPSPNRKPVRLITQDSGKILDFNSQTEVASFLKLSIGRVGSLIKRGYGRGYWFERSS